MAQGTRDNCEGKVSEQISVLDVAARELADCTNKYKIAVKELFHQVRQFNAERACCTANKEVQTDEVQPVQFQLVANSADPLQRENYTVKSLHMQLASFALSLRMERKAKENVELELNRWQKECEELRLQLQRGAAQSNTVESSDQSQRITALQQTVDELRAQMQKKQSEMDSILEDLDETRHKMYAHIENEKRQYEALQRASQLTAINQQSSRITTLQHEPDELRAQMQKKQSELNSVLEDLDETRHKLYEHVENEKRQQCLLTANDTQIEKLRQTIRELESQAEIEKSQLQMELESTRNGDQFKDTKLTAAQNEADNLRQEIQRLKQSEDELNEQTIALQMTVNDMKTLLIDKQAKQRQLQTENEDLRLQLQSASQLTAESDQQSSRITALQQTVGDIRDQLQKKQSELDSVLEDLDETRHKLYEHVENEKRQQVRLAANETQAENLRQQIRELKNSQPEIDVEQVMKRLAQAEHQLMESTVKLKESEGTALEMQNYASHLESQLEVMKRQLEKSLRMRDEVLSVTEQLRNQFELQLTRSAELEAELSKLRDKHAEVEED